jgi:hypothetical protein
MHICKVYLSHAIHHQYVSVAVTVIIRLTTRILGVQIICQNVYSEPLNVTKNVTVLSLYISCLLLKSDKFSSLKTHTN